VTIYSADSIISHIVAVLLDEWQHQLT